MKSIAKYTGKLIVTGLTLCLSMTNVFANTLSEIEVYQNGSGYGVTLKTDSVTTMKKMISSSDRMSVVLKDVSVSENLNTVYNNVSKMDNITVQPVGKSDIKVIFKGKGISNSTVSFASASNIAAYPEAKTIQLNGPVSSYTPVYSPEKFATEEMTSQTTNPQLNEVLTNMHISREMILTAKRYAKSAIVKTKSFAKSLMNGNMNMLSVFGILLIAAMFMFKPRKATSKKQQSSGISGLQSRANIEREIGINKQLVNNMNLNSSLKNNYGVKAYQQSQRNPYMAANITQSNGISGLSRRKVSSSIDSAVESTTVTRDSAPLKNAVLPMKKQSTNTVLPKLPRVAKEKESKAVSTPISRPSIATMSAKKPALQNNVQPEIDSMKFLESITKIYEKSGRTDLAKGLKDNLRKAQMSKAI